MVTTTRLYTAPMTCAVDGVAHEVTDETVATSTAGFFTALCGYDVRPGALVEEAGRPCPRCEAILLASLGRVPTPTPFYVEIPAQRSQITRHRRHSRFWRLLHHDHHLADEVTR